MSEKMKNLLDKMWTDYVATNPDAQKIHDLFASRGDKVINDHIALRTFNLPKVNVDQIAKPFLEAGYVEKGTYDFEEKKLFAKHYEHPDFPTVFISQLLTENFSDEAQEIMKKLVDQVTDEQLNDFNFSTSGRPWETSSQDYETLKKESEYAAWLSAWGYRPNHFTVFINALDSIETIEDLNKIVKENGYELNASGGEIKGSSEVYLEQSSTIANNHDVQFSDKTLNIPSTYYEFAKRYPLEDGNLYSGFVAKSADKIFESTDKGQ
jgi:hypothetical protein